MPTIVRKSKRDVGASEKKGGDAQVNAAVASLEKGVQHLVQHHERRIRKRLGLEDGDELPEMEERRRTAHQKRIRAVVQHIRHCLTELRQKLTALQAALECYTTQLLPSFPHHIQQSGNRNNNKHSAAISIAALQHVFQWLLRLHDGYILTVSGECRHTTDVEAAKQSKHPSQLNHNTTNTVSSSGGLQDAMDGYSTTTTTTAVLYAADKTYSGAAWDEWMDPRHGLRTRLLTRLQPLLWQQQQQRNTFWDDWTEPGKPAFPLESIICDIEVQMQQIQSQFTEITKTKLVSVITRALQQQQSRGSTTTVTVNLHWQDKMEQLHVFSPVTGKVQLERYAGDFQVCGSVLPVHYATAQQWWEHGGMQWATKQNNKKSVSISKQQEPTKKRRKVIEDSSSDEEDTKPSTTAVSTKNSLEKENKTQQQLPSAAGLVIKVVDAVKNDKSTALQSSVNSIKKQFGVNVAGMQEAFDGLQAEEAGAVREADLVDNAPVDAPLQRDELYYIQLAERRVKRKKRALLRALDDVDYDDADTAIWNAREVLREASMRAGDLILWSDVVRTPDDNRDGGDTTTRTMLQKSIQYFTYAKDLVAAQQKLYERMNHSKDFNDDARFFRRNLLLLKGQAQTNAGIATIELALQCYMERDPVRKVLLQTGCKELDGAVASTNAMKSRATEDALSAANPTETTLDLFRAQQLESLALRWKATALWHLYQKHESFQAFHVAASVFQTPRSSSFPKSFDHVVLDAEIECRLECYNAWTTLADLVSRSLEGGTVALIRESPAFYEKLLDYVAQALNYASTASKSIQEALCSCPDKYDNLCNEGSLLTSEELLLTLKDIREWWNRRTVAAKQPIIEDSATLAVPSCPRNDLLSDGGPPSTEALPTRRFVAGRRTRPRSKYNLGGVGYSNIGNTFEACTEEQVIISREPRKYRKWREDMIFDEKIGKMIPKLIYPSIAPEMPPHIAAILAARRQQSNP